MNHSRALLHHLLLNRISKVLGEFVDGVRLNSFVFVVMLVLVNYSLAQANELVPLKIVMNTVDKGEFFVLLKSKTDVLIYEEDYKSLGIRSQRISTEIDGVKYVSLNDLKDELEYVVDEKNLELRIDINPALLKKTELDLTQETVISSNPFGIDSAFVNVSAIAIGTSKDNLKKIEMPIETVISAHDLLLQVNFTRHRPYENGLPIDDYLARGITNITKDYPRSLNRLIVGDVHAGSGETGGSGIFLGASYRKKFSMATLFTKYPSVTVNGLLRTPSKVNMYVNGVLIRSETLPPGEFKISNLPNLYGAGNLEMEITDAFGRVVRREIPYYVSTKLLRVGLNDFMYTVGFKRENGLSEKQAEYDSNPSLLGFHRYGFSSFFTGGYRFEFTDGLSNLGVMSNLLLGAYGELDAGFSFSKNQNNLGTSRYFRYGFTSRYFHGRYSYSHRSEKYSTVSIGPDLTVESVSDVENEVDLTRPKQSVGVGVHGLVVGSLSLNYGVRGGLFTPQERDYSLIYSLRIAKQASLLARATRIEDVHGDVRHLVVVSINAALGRKMSANATHSDDQGDKKTSAYIQKSLPVGTGYGGRIRATNSQPKDGNESTLADGSLKLKTKYFSASGDYNMGEQENTYLTQIAGSLAFIDNDFYFTRPIQDSFGLAKVDDLDDVRVYYSNEMVGKTSNGRLLVPNLVSYADNHISIEGQDVPVDRALKNTRLKLSPKFRTGSVALFEVEKFQGFFGIIYLVKNQTKKTADLASLTLLKQDRVFETIIGKGGEFYVENLEPGKYHAELKLDGELCQFKITIPKSKEMMVELGEYVCTM